MSSQTLWYLSRAAGLVSFVVLSLVMVMGAYLSRRGKVPGLPRFAGVSLHRNASLFALLLVALHIITAVVDPYVSIGWLAAVVPFTSHYQPMWMGIGAFSVDLVIAVVITSLVRFRIGLKAWRAIHWLAYAAWPIATVHSVAAAAELNGVLLASVFGMIAVVGTAIAWRFGLMEDPPAVRAA